MCILVELQIVDRRLQEAIETQVCWEDFLDDQSGGVCNACLRSADTETYAHAVFSFHQVNCVAHRQWTVTNFVDCLLVSSLNIIKVDLSMDVIQLLLHLLEQLFALNCSFVHLLLQSCLLDCFICNVIQLSDQKVVHFGCRVSRHDAHDIGNFPFEFDDLFQKLGPHLLLLNLPDQFLILVDLLILLFDSLIDLSSLFEIHLLQSLYLVKEALLRELNLGLHEQLSRWDRYGLYLCHALVLTCACQHIYRKCII